MSKDEVIIRFFSRHMVLMYFDLQRGESILKTFVPMFVLSAADEWFLVTAGHWLNEIAEKIAQGYKVEECTLVDSLGQGAKYQNLPIPFYYGSSNSTSYCDEYGFDYGFIKLSLYYRELLATNNIQALNEEVWKQQSTDEDTYMLLGMPGERVKFDSDGVEMTSLLLPVKRLTKRPDGFPEMYSDDHLFYGHIELVEGIQSIQGMSGGPIFAFRQDKNGHVRYILVAVQSSWLPNSHIIKACPTYYLGHYLEALVRDKKE